MDIVFDEIIGVFIRKLNKNKIIYDINTYMSVTDIEYRKNTIRFNHDYYTIIHKKRDINNILMCYECDNNTGNINLEMVNLAFCDIFG